MMMATIASTATIRMMAAATVLLMVRKLGVSSEISECTIIGAASRCSQKAQSERRRHAFAIRHVVAHGGGEHREPARETEH